MKIHKTEKSTTFTAARQTSGCSSETAGRCESRPSSRRRPSSLSPSARRPQSDSHARSRAISLFSSKHNKPTFNDERLALGTRHSSRVARVAVTLQVYRTRPGDRAAVLLQQRAAQRDCKEPALAFRLVEASDDHRTGQAALIFVDDLGNSPGGSVHGWQDPGFHSVRVKGLIEL